MDWCSAWGRSLLGLWDPEGRPAMAPRNSLDTPKDEGTCTQWWIRSEYANMIKYAWTTPDDIQYTFWFASKRHHILSPNSATTWIAHPSLCDASPSLQWQAYQFLPFWSFLNFSPWNSQEDSFFWECFLKLMKLTQFDNLFVLPWPRAFIDAPFAAGPTKPPGLVWTRLWKNAYKVAMGSWLRRCKKRNYWGNLVSDNAREVWYIQWWYLKYVEIGEFWWIVEMVGATSCDFTYHYSLSNCLTSWWLAPVDLITSRLRHMATQAESVPALLDHFDEVRDAPVLGFDDFSGILMDFW